MDIFDRLSLAGLIPVIKVEDAADAVPLCRALQDGGLPVAEITFRTAAAEQAIKNVHEELPDVMLGAGTVLSTEQVARAVDAGATYIVSPGLNPTVVRHCQDRGIPILPGCANPSDIEAALALGINTVKFFPAEALGGLKLIKAMSAPYGQVSFVPTGGVTADNCAAYLAFSKVRAVGGSWMVPDDAIKQKDWARITQLTRQAVDRMLGLTLTRVIVNSDSARADAERLSQMLGWDVTQTQTGVLAGGAVELTSDQSGQLVIGTNSVTRAAWHLKRRGFAFTEDASGQMLMQGAIAGLAIRLIQK